MSSVSLRQQVEQLRKKGKTYPEIKGLLRINIPKSTLSYWCRNVLMPKGYQARIQRLNKLHLSEGCKISADNRKLRQKAFQESVDRRNKGLLGLFEKDIRVRKISLTVLYLGEGSKTARGSLMFGNSDPATVRMFVDLLRECYTLDERKFRCTLQCRADQNIEKLEKFWSKITRIPSGQFYKARIDKRTLGQITEKRGYKGVCRIDYFSSTVDLELKRIAQSMSATFK